MTLYALYNSVKDHMGFCWVVLITSASLVQVSPIKINPLSWLAKSIGKALNGDLSDKINSLDKKVDRLSADIAEDKAKTARARILQFGDELLIGQMHSKDSFDSVLVDIDAYETYCRANPNFKNNMTELTTRKIKDIYYKCLNEKTFL